MEKRDKKIPQFPARPKPTVTGGKRNGYATFPGTP